MTAALDLLESLGWKRPPGPEIELRSYIVVFGRLEEVLASLGFVPSSLFVERLN